jgi:uncharacterized protein (DUF1684 family)
MLTNFIRTAVCLLALLVTAVAAEPDYAGGIEAWRAKRLERLTTPDGWLSLIGLHFLQPGSNTVGTAPDNTIVLAKGPAHLGTVVLGEGGRATLTLNPAASALIDGVSRLSAELDEGKRGKPTLVSCGTVSFFLIERGGKKALRVKDSESERRVHFLGIDHFPIDPAWRIEAKWVAFDRAKEIPITNILGQTSPALVLGKAVFERDGKTVELLPIQESPDDDLFFVISDLTSGTETYAAARFLYAEPPQDGKVVLDFNRAVNPPCAFTPYATCPLPPKENRLPLAVTAGEKNTAARTIERLVSFGARK